MGPESVLCEVGYASVLERLGRVQVLAISSMLVRKRRPIRAMLERRILLTSNLRYTSHPSNEEMWMERIRGVSCQSLLVYAISKY